MQGAKQGQKLGYQWMRVGFATLWFRIVAIFLFVCTMLALAFWAYLALPPGPWHMLRFAALYVGAALLYINFGVWIHEQLHCLAYRGPEYAKRAHIYYARKYLIGLNGWYSVTGPIGYRVLRGALLGPMILVAAWILIAWVGSLALPGWWAPLMLTLAAMSLMDMLHDLYWLARVRSIGELGKYWDNGRALDVVWKPAPPLQLPSV